MEEKKFSLVRKDGSLRGVFKQIPCKKCGKIFQPYSGYAKFCCKKCGKKFGKLSTEEQYRNISGNWKKYFLRLLQCHGRKSSGLTVDHLIDLLKLQEYKCALSGVELSCFKKRGVNFKTNASIDRVDPKGPYSPDNIQLVCKCLNSFRSDLSVEDFIDWCKKVAKFNE